MQYIDGLDSKFDNFQRNLILKKNRNFKIALGVFDGVHLGHMKVIEQAHLVLTFDPHPNPEIKLLTTLKERNTLINRLEVIHFTKKLWQMTPEAFVKNYLVEKYDPTEVIVGFDFRFGKNRAGDVHTLKRLGKKYKFEVRIVQPYVFKGKVVKSSLIREYLYRGKIQSANQLLGRQYFLTGKVVKGSGRGQSLGIPTANLKVDAQKLIPKSGVYACEAIVKNQSFKAAVNIGLRPTFDEKQAHIEVHLLEYQEGPLYGQPLTLLFDQYLRPEKKFNAVSALLVQIKKDILQVKNKLN